MGDKIYLYWFKHKRGHGNFGDELNPYIFSKLTDVPFKHIRVDLLWNSKFFAIKSLSKLLLRGKIGIRTFWFYSYINAFVSPQICLGVGSVLQSCRYHKTIIWGSGIISQDSRVPNGKYVAVRGYKTIERIKEKGFTPPQVVGDPALLLPKLFNPKVQKRFKVGIIPHYSHYEDVKKNFSDSVIKVINMEDPIEKVIKEIMSCELTVSTSLHGIIVSHAYGIKSIRAINASVPLYGDNIKFKDYYSSVSLEDYIPLNIEEIYGYDSDTITDMVEAYKMNEMLPEGSVLETVQEELLAVFPFSKKDHVKLKS